MKTLTTIIIATALAAMLTSCGNDTHSQSAALKKKAKQGDATAQFNLGEYYDKRYDEKGSDKDRSEAVNWYRKAAEQGHAGAQFNIGVCYDTGDCVEMDKAEAMKWWLKAAAQGYDKAKAAIDLKIKATKEGMSTIKTAAQTFMIRNGNYPDSIDGLTQPNGGFPPVLNVESTIDPFGNPFSYKKMATSLEIRSAGPDGTMETLDDLVINF